MSVDKSELEAKAPEKEDKKTQKKPLITDKRIEIAVAALLGLTALLSAWATWIGSLHGGIQSINFTKSNNYASNATATYNSTVQLYLSDLMTWNTVSDYQLKAKVARVDGKKKEAEIYEEKADSFLKQNSSEILLDAIGKMDESMNSPFEVEGIREKYIAEAEKLYADSINHLEEGKRDNSKGDAYNLVEVIYSIVLFLLGIVGVLKDRTSRVMILLISIIGIAITTIYMCTIPLPTGFNIFNYFGILK